MSEEKKESCCSDEKSGCGCGCGCAGKAALVLLLLLVGGIVGFLMGRCGKKMPCPMMGAAGPMAQTAPAVPGN